MRKAIDILIIVMLVLGILQIALPSDDLNVKADTPDDGINGLQYIDGNWTVTGPESYTNEIIVLTGNLSIESGGSLILRNVTLAMNCTTGNGTFNIDVNTGGSLIITDGDNDPTTTYDRSNITDSPFDVDDWSSNDYRYAIRVWMGASISINNSIIREAGYPGNWQNCGLYTDWVDNVNIENCTFERNYYGIYINRGSNHRVGYNEFMYSEEYGLYFGVSSNTEIYNNTIHHCDIGLYCRGSYYTIFNNYIHNNSLIFPDSPEWKEYGMYLSVSDSEIYNNTIETSGGGTYCENVELVDCDRIQFHHNTISDVKPGSFSGFYLAYDCSYMEIHNNTISNNVAGGLRFYGSGTSHNNRFVDNNISNNGYGAQLESWGDGSEGSYLIFENNVLYDNILGMRLQELRTYNITNNTITSCVNDGVYLNDVHVGLFSNNTISATNNDFSVSDSYAPQDMVFEALNCTFNHSKIDFPSGSPEMIISYFLHLNVTDDNSWVPGAYVVVRNNTDSIVFEGESDENGQIEYIKIKNQTANKNGRIYYDPHNITATLDVYTAYGEIEPIMNISQTVNVHFNVDLPPLPPGNLVAVSNETDVDLSWDPSKSTDVDHYLVYRNDTGPGWVEVYNSASDPPKKLWTNWTDPQAASDWASYRYYVTTVDLVSQESPPSNIARCGDWVVDTTKTVSDLSIQLNGSLIILPTGYLTLRNVKIQFNCSFTQEFGIEVLPNGKLWILDSDNDPQTTADQSMISTLDWMYNLYFVMLGPEFVMKNSRLSNCGSNESLEYSSWDHEFKAPEIMTVGEPSIRGLYIADTVSYVVIENNEFSKNFVSILIDRADGCTVSGNTFSDNIFGIYLNNSRNNTMSGNTFSDHGGFPVYLCNSENNTFFFNDIMNPSNTEAGIVLYDDGCIINRLFNNNFTGGKYGIVALDAGNNNNISKNNFSDQLKGIYLRYTSWTMISENDFNNTSSYDCHLESASFTTINMGTSNLAYTGYYLWISDDVTITNVIIENASSDGINLQDSNNIQIINVSFKSCGKGVAISSGDNIKMEELTIKDCTTGINCFMNPINIKLSDSTVDSDTQTAVYINVIDNFIIDNCTLNATNYNFNLKNAQVTSFNTTFNQNKITLDSTSSISLWWLVNVQVLDWLDNPQANADVQIRQAAGTLIFSGVTDMNGYIGWIWVHERIQFSTFKESYTPHSFHAQFDTHAGDAGLKLNQSTLVTVWLENLAPTVSNVIISPSYPTTIDDLDLSYQYNDDENDPEGNTMIIWYIDGIHNTTFNNQTKINSSFTFKDQTWFCEVVPHDGTTYGPPMTSTPVSIQNTPPVVTNVTIVETEPRSSENLHVSYDYSDIDNDPEAQSQYRWYIDNGSGSGFVYSGVDALELVSGNTKKGELWKCIVTPNDGDDLGASIESQVVTINNSAPEVFDAGIQPSSPNSNESLLVNYTYFDLDNDPELGSEIRWYKNDVEQWSLNDSVSVDSSLTLKGEMWYYIVTPSDGDDFGVPIQSEPVSIGNTPPLVFNITISPLNPTTEDDLNVSYEFFDIDGDSESLDTVIKWLRKSGFEFFDTGFRGKTLPSEPTSKGEVWTCEVIPHDGMSEGMVYRSNMNVTIANSQPEVLNARIDPLNPTSDSILSVDYDFWDVDFDLESGSMIRWYKNDVGQWNLNDSVSVDFSLTLKGEMWYYIITPSDGEDFGVAFKSDSVTIGNTPPYVLNITIAPQNPDTKDGLTVSYEFYDNDGDSESLDTVVKWLRWSGSDYFDTGFRGKILSSDHTSKGERWTCEVIPHDGKDEGTATRSDTNVTINNSAPAVLSAYVMPSEPTADSDLMANYDYSDPDSDLESGSKIRWYKNDVEQWNLNDSNSVDHSLTQGNEEWYYIVTPSDGEVFGSSLQSDTVTIGNTPPYVRNVTITPSDPTTEDDLTVSYDFYDSDGDSESLLNTTIRWLRWSGSVFFDTGLRGKTLPSDYTSKGEIWNCEVIPHDGVEAGIANRSDKNVTINNSAPWVLNVHVTPSNPTADSDLMVDYDFSDPDDDTESGSIIRWYKNDVEQWNLNDSNSVDHSLTQGNEEWYYIVTPYDGEDFGIPVQSTSVVIGNTPPYVSNITIAPLNPDTEDDLTVSYEFNDTDGDSESLDTTVKWLRWSVDEFFDTGLRGKTLSSDHTSKGEKWTCEVIPHDGIDEGTATRSDMNVTINNSAPSVLSAYVTPSEPTADSDLIANYDYSDPDGDTESGSMIRWYKNGLEQWNLNDSNSVDHSLTQGNEEWYYIITPSDGEEFGASVQSTSVIIGNTPPYVSNIIISPSDPKTEDDLIVTYDYYDSDGDLESLDTMIRWLWWNGIEFFDSGLRGSILSSDHTSRNQMWTCDVIPHDGVDYGTATRSSQNVTIGNSPPAISNAYIKPDNPTSDSDLLTDYDYFDVNSDLESGSLIRWFRNGFEQADLYGLFIVNHSKTLKGDIWHYIITPSDGDVYGDPVQSENITIGNTPPQVDNIAISPLNPTAPDDLVVSYDFYDSDGDSESLDTVIKWLHWSGSEFVDTGFRGKTLSSVHTSKNEIWTCEVRPHDGTSEGAIVSSGILVTITNSPPVAQNAFITPENPTTESTLVANYDYSDLDSDPESATEIIWYRDGAHVSKLDDQLAVPHNETEKGQVWNFTVRPKDGYDFGEKVESESITIYNNPPTAKDLSISPNPPRGDDDLIATYTFLDEDDDTEEGFEITWYQGVFEQDIDGLEVDSSATRKDELWYYVLRVFDGEDWSESLSSHYVIIENSMPTASISPSMGQYIINETDSLDFSVDAEDPDGDFLLYKWKLDRSTVEDDEDYSFETDYESSGTYKLNLTVQDIGENSFALYYEWTIVVQNVNRKPQIEGQQPVEREHTMREDTSLKFSIQASDPDSEDLPHLTITWYIDDGVAQSGGSSFTYHPDYTAAGNHVVKAIVDDGTDSVEHSWNLTVEDVPEIAEGEERMLGLTWDQWGITLEIFVIAGTGFLAFIGYRRLKKKKGALKVYMSEIDEISDHKDEDPIGYENRLNELEIKINEEFKQGNIEDLHYLMLQEIITGKRGEVRRAAVAHKFDRLPEGVTKELNEMLKDGKISSAEYERFVATMSQTKSLTPNQRKELSRMLEKWEAEDKDFVAKEPSSEKVEPKKEEIDKEIDDIIDSLDEKSSEEE